MSTGNRARAADLMSGSLEVSAFAREIFRFQPDSNQARLLDSPARRGILCCSRQWGKSTTVAVKAAHHMLTVPGAFVLVCGPCSRQATETFSRIREFTRTLDPSRRGDGQNEHSLVLSNGSRLVALPDREGNLREVRPVSAASAIEVMFTGSDPWGGGVVGFTRSGLTHGAPVGASRLVFQVRVCP